MTIPTKEKQLIMLPGPTNVPDRVMQAMLKPIINHRGPEFEALYDSLIGNLKYVFQTKQDAYVLTASGTGSVECAISNITNPGDKIIIPMFGFFTDRIKEKILRRGGKPVEIPVKWGTAPTAEQIEETVKKEKNAKAVAIVCNETSTGVTVREMPAVGEITAENNMLLFADAVSILGGDQLPVDKWNIDLCVAASQKCLAAPPGISVISVSQKAWKTIEQTRNKPYYFDLTHLREFGNRKATPSTPALPLFYALNEALKMIKEEGLEARFKRHAKCSQAFYKALQTIDFTPYPNRKVRSNVVIAVNLPKGVESATVRQTMKNRYKIEITGGLGKNRDQILRIGCMGIISEKETTATINAIENTLKTLNCKAKLGVGVEAARKVFHP